MPRIKLDICPVCGHDNRVPNPVCTGKPERGISHDPVVMRSNGHKRSGYNLRHLWQCGRCGRQTIVNNQA